MCATAFLDNKHKLKLFDIVCQEFVIKNVSVVTSFPVVT